MKREARRTSSGLRCRARSWLLIGDARAWAARRPIAVQLRAGGNAPTPPLPHGKGRPSGRLAFTVLAAARTMGRRRLAAASSNRFL